jgi:hypothetical protein
MVAGYFEPLVIPWRPLPDRVRTLVDWGRITPRFNPRRLGAAVATGMTMPTLIDDDDKTLPQLPIRIPGAALQDVPPEDISLHITMPRQTLRYKPWDWVIQWWWGQVNKISIMESDESFARWWEDTWATAWPSFQPGRHRREMLTLDPGWRSRWADFDTQGWPTLATAGNAWDTLGERPTICATGKFLKITSRVSTLKPRVPTYLFAAHKLAKSIR